ncbi:MAG: membrane protein YqaA with SNARE-associated domain [Verrucomicrobiales bacterium]|jgi:membrane protein YqaA with SNARE-associated domain
MPQRSPRAELWLIAGVFAATSLGLWLLGRALDEPLLSFAGLMTTASTFVPMPADAYVIHAAETISPIWIAILGGAINAVAVLGERLFLQRLIGFPIFDRIRNFIGTNRFVTAMEDQMFLGLIVAAASPLPFEVFRFVAVARDYSPTRYAVATFIGRGTRFYALAAAGGFFAAHGLGPYALGALIVLFALGLVRSIRRMRSLDAAAIANAPEI